MFFKTQAIENRYDKLAEKIKKDLVKTLQRQGINISMVDINIKSGNLNVSVGISENRSV